jgi:mRNA export factor
VFQDGSKVFTASCDKTAKMWDLNSNQAVQVAQHDAPVKTVSWVKAPTYTCLMTASWDKTLKVRREASLHTSHQWSNF